MQLLRSGSVLVKHCIEINENTEVMHRYEDRSKWQEGCDMTT